MRSPRLEIVQLFAALIIVLIAGCGKETVNIPDTTPPPGVIHHARSRCDHGGFKHPSYISV
jgi:hypothetical protein